jgi:hypothetical protein
MAEPVGHLLSKPKNQIQGKNYRRGGVRRTVVTDLAALTPLTFSMAGALVVDEALKLFNQGVRYDEIIFSPRNMLDSNFRPSKSKMSFSKIAQMEFSIL